MPAITHTYTNLHCYDDVCPHQYWRRYIVKDLPFVQTEAMKWGNFVHSAFEQRVAGKKPLPVSLQQWERFASPFDSLPNVKVEMKLAMTADGQPCDYWKDPWLRGKGDVVCVNGDVGFINDWKSGSSKYEDPFELEVHAVMLHVKHPNLKAIKGTYTWLKDDKVSEVFDLSHTGRTFKRLKEIESRIERDKASGSFEKKRGPLCAWCNCFDCENNTSPDKPK